MVVYANKRVTQQAATAVCNPNTTMECDNTPNTIMLTFLSTAGKHTGCIIGCAAPMDPFSSSGMRVLARE